MRESHPHHSIPRSGGVIRGISPPGLGILLYMTGWTCNRFRWLSRMINKHKTAYAMIVLLQNYKYNCPCFCIANKQIDTVFHGEAGRKNLCLCSLTIKILKLMNTLLLNATSSKRKRITSEGHPYSQFLCIKELKWQKKELEWKHVFLNKFRFLQNN